jgi:glucans biosynthesis protein C
MGGASALIGRRAASDQGAPEPADGRRRRLACYANEAVLPFYVLHETVIIAVAYVVLSWPIGGAAQYAVIVALSLAGTLLLYEIAVRRTPPTRWLFGLRPAGAGSAARRGS